jgi:hypothetical protein
MRKSLQTETFNNTLHLKYKEFSGFLQRLLEYLHQNWHAQDHLQIEQKDMLAMSIQ